VELSWRPGRDVAKERTGYAATFEQAGTQMFNINGRTVPMPMCKVRDGADLSAYLTRRARARRVNVTE
jgi:hypothetical protein